MNFVLIVATIVGAAVGFVVLYYVVKAAILNALREHTMNSTTAVSVVSAVPLRVAAPVEDGDTQTV